MLKRLSVAVCVLLMPMQVAAASIHFEHDGGGFSSIGPGGFQLFTELESPDWAFQMALETGAALSVAPGASGGTEYAFGGGVLTLSGIGGVLAVIPVAPFTISLSAPDQDPIWDALPYPGPVSEMDGLLFVALGSGTLDPALAHALGVSTHTLGGSLQFIVDDFYGTPADAVRQAVPNWLAGDIDLRDVPEPSALVLASLGIGFAIRRRIRMNAQAAEAGGPGTASS